MKDITEYVEIPLKDLVKLLRNKGFNTIGSCGHLPEPYINIDRFDEENLESLYNLLVENGYKNFQLRLIWMNTDNDNSKFLDITFFPKKRLANLRDIKNI